MCAAPGYAMRRKHRRTQGCLRQEARPTSSGSDAAAQEVMPGETSGEVMLALPRQEAKERASHLQWPVRLRLASLCLAKANSASRAKNR